MKTKQIIVFALAVGLLGTSVLFKYLSPISAFAQQSQAPTLIPPSAQSIEFTTLQGIKLGDFDTSHGAIKLSPLVKLRVRKTAQTVTLELSK